MASGVWRASVSRLEYAEEDVIRPGSEEIGKEDDGPRCKTLLTGNPSSFIRGPRSLSSRPAAVMRKDQKVTKRKNNIWYRV